MRENLNFSDEEAQKIANDYVNSREDKFNFPKVDRENTDPEVYRDLVLTKSAVLNAYLPTEVARNVFEVMLDPNIPVLNKRDIFRSFEENGPWAKNFEIASNPGRNPGSIH